jgi:hypothetical protein
MPGFALRPVDETFFESAPEVVAETFDVAKPASEVWSELTADGALSFCRSLRGARWTSPRPFGVGTTRTMPALYGLLVIDEVYFRWEEGRQHSFYVERANLPMFRSLAEDYLVEPAGPSACRFTWTLAMEPTALGKLGSPLNARIVKDMFSDMRRHFSDAP